MNIPIDRVVVKQRFEFRDRLDIWFCRFIDQNTTAILSADLQEVKYNLDPRTSLREPSLSMSAYAAEMLFKELSGQLPPSSATDRHLKDTIEVRDKLLVMIDRVIK